MLTFPEAKGRGSCVEYALTLVLIGAVGVAVIGALGPAISHVFWENMKNF